MNSPHRLAAWGLALALLWLAACAAGPPAPKPPASKPPAPAQSPLPAAPPDGRNRVCLWIFWTDNHTLMKEAQALLAQGRPFQSVALSMARNNQGYATTNADCLPRSSLPPAMAAAIKDLKLGQVSQPFPLNQGAALAMLTSDAFRRKAKELYKAGKYKQAMEQLKLDLELHPAAANSWHLLALCRAATGDRKGALEAYDRALEWTPNAPAVLNDKATLLTQMGRRDQAVVLYRRALASDPNNPVFMNNLAWALAQQKRDLGEALALAQKAAALAPDNPAVWDTLGQVQQARGDYAGAVVSFHRAARLDPQAAGVKKRMLGSLLALKPDQVSRLSQEGAAPPPRPASPPPAKPAPAAQPPAKPAPPQPQPAPAPAPRPPAPANKPPPAQPAPRAKPAPAPATSPKPQFQAKAAAAPAPRAAQAAPDQGRPPRGWYLQLASNRNPKLAARARRRWTAKGYGAQVWAWRSAKSGLWHRLLLGPYPSKAKARYNGRLLQQAGEIKTFVLIRVP